MTVKLGQEAVLSCSVVSKGDFKVGWIKVRIRIIVVMVAMVVVDVEVMVVVMVVKEIVWRWWMCWCCDVGNDEGWVGADVVDVVGLIVGLVVDVVPG